MIPSTVLERNRPDPPIVFRTALSLHDISANLRARANDWRDSAVPAELRAIGVTKLILEEKGDELSIEWGGRTNPVNNPACFLTVVRIPGDGSEVTARFGRGTLQVFPRRRRIQELERTVLDNPSAGNYEELGLLYLDDGNFARARACYDKAISSRSDHADPFYRRGISEVELGDFPAAVPDLERAVKADPGYDFHRAKGLLAWAYAQTGQIEKAEARFREAVQISTISETYYHYALFLQSQGCAAEAREWARRILEKKPTMPVYLRRRERPWFRKANSLLARLPAG